VLTHESTYGHPRTYCTTSVPVLSITRQKRDIFTTEIPSRSQTVLLHSKLVPSTVSKKDLYLQLRYATVRKLMRKNRRTAQIKRSSRASRRTGLANCSPAGRWRICYLWVQQPRARSMLKEIQYTSVTLRHRQQYCDRVCLVEGMTAKRVGIETKNGLTSLQVVWRAE
jgi:hypothetical protein